MKKSIPSIPYMGDNIITTKKFKYGAGKKGILRIIRGDSFGIQFTEALKKNANEKIGGSHDLDQILKENTGYFLHHNEFKITNTYTNANKNKELFVKMLQQKYYSDLANVPVKIKQIENNVTSKHRNIKDKHAMIKIQEEEVVKLLKTISKLKESPEKKVSITSFEKRFNKLKSHKLIKNIKLIENFIIITTEDLIYHGQDIKDFNLGAFKIFLNREHLSTIPKTINYKRQMLKGKYFHPCIEDGGQMCLGDQLRNEIEKLGEEGEIAALIFLLINFLQEPNYRDPYIRAHIFSLAQKVTLKPTNVLDYLSSNYWYENEIWDEIKFQEEKKKLINRLGTDNI